MVYRNRLKSLYIQDGSERTHKTQRRFMAIKYQSPRHLNAGISYKYKNKRDQFAQSSLDSYHAISPINLGPRKSHSLPTHSCYWLKCTISCSHSSTYTFATDQLLRCRKSRSR